MPARHFILATAGHVDHGKSSLVKALTGTDPDRLPEEKARGITIDLGFAHLRLEHGPEGSPPAAGTPGSETCGPCVSDIGIVDVPGHEDFVRNMVAGVGAVDLALLVVAADDGWMPQTEEHLQILAYLGVQHAIVALTKADLALDLQSSLAAIRRHLQGSPFAESPIVPTSTVTVEGILALRQTLAKTFAQITAPPDLGKPRLGVDRAFTLRGVGTIATGTLLGGRLHRGQEVVVQPREIHTRIRNLQSHSSNWESAPPGTRVALNLPDLEPGTSIVRGDVVTLPALGPATLTWDVLLHKSGRLKVSPASAARPLRDGTLVKVHSGSAHTLARVHLDTPEALLPGESRIAQLRLETPLFAFAGDRLVLRDAAEQTTLAGALILDAQAHRRGFRQPIRRNLLLEQAAHPEDALAYALTELRRDRLIRCDALLLRTRFHPSAILAASERLLAGKQALLVGEQLAEASWWADLRQEAIRTVDQHHQAHPDQPGLPAATLTSVLQRHCPAAVPPETLLPHVLAPDLLQAGSVVRRRGFCPSLPNHLQAAGRRISELLAGQRLGVPSRKELAPDPASQQALRFLIQAGTAVELSQDVVLGLDAFEQAKEEVRVALANRGAATASELREVLGTSRRILIPLLEHLDRLGFTRRDGDRRRLRSPSP